MALYPYQALKPPPPPPFLSIQKSVSKDKQYGSFSLDSDAPGISLITILDTLNPVLHLSSDLTGLLVSPQTTVNLLTLPSDGTDGGDDSSSTGTEDLDKSTFRGRSINLVHGQFPLRNLPSLGAKVSVGKREHRVTGDTLKNGAVQGSSDQLGNTSLLVLDSDEQVHGADLSHVLLLAEEPEVLLVSAGSSLELRNDARGVVGAELLVANTAGPGTDGVVGGFELDGLEACGVVRADRGGDEEEESGTGGTDAESVLCSDHCWAEVKRIATGTGNDDVSV